MKALTIQHPWAFAIAEGFKTVENRTWARRYRGPVAIHAGQQYDNTAVLVRRDRAAAVRLDELGGRSNFWAADTRIPSKLFPAPPTSLAHNAIIAVAQLTDIHICGGVCSPWAEPDVHHWVLEDVVQLPAPVVSKGRLGLWNPTDDLMTAVREQLEAVAR